MGSGVQPGEPASEVHELGSLVLHIYAIDIGDLQLSACGGADLVCDLGDVLVIEVQAGYGVVGQRVRRFFFQRLEQSVLAQGPHCVALGVGDRVPEQGAPLELVPGRAQYPVPSCAVEDVVAENERALLACDVPLPDYEGLRYPLGLRLRRIGEIDPEGGAVAEKLLKIW